MKKNNKKIKYYIVMCLLLIVGIGYAALVSNISINGYSKFKSSSFDLHFENYRFTILRKIAHIKIIE